MTTIVRKNEIVTLQASPEVTREVVEVREGGEGAVVIEGRGKFEVEAYLKERGAGLRIFGGFRGEDAEEQHIVLRIVQDAPDTDCRVRFRAALRDSSQSSFDGLITMTKRAAGARGHLSYKALLLSKNARAKPIPRLEILTKSVASAGHEASVGKIDEQQLFYLQSRGLSREEAERLIVEGFLT